MKKAIATPPNEPTKYIDLTQEEIIEKRKQEKIEQQKMLLDFVSRYRKEVGSGDVTINGVIIAGDKSTRTAIAETIAFLEKIPASQRPVIDWEAKNGFFKLTYDDIVALGKAIGVKRQKSFTAKNMVLDAVNNGKVKTIDEARVMYDTIMAQ